jgi:hypothetical protein
VQAGVGLVGVDTVVSGHSRMLESVLCAEAGEGVHGEQLAHQVLGRLADAVPVGRGEVGGAGLDPA